MERARITRRLCGNLVVLTAAVLAAAGGSRALRSQVLIQGRVHAEIDGPADQPSLSTILAIASLPGAKSEALSFRTWETHPAGWFRLSGSAGRYTLVFSNPAHYMRPRVLTNQFLREGESLDLRVSASFDYARFHEKAWDREPARRYYQPFVARGTAVTAVGFKLSSDGVDGPGPGKQDVLVSIHRRGRGQPESWPQVGPTARVVGVDCGGAKSYWYSAGWNSGEVEMKPGGGYAVSIRPADPEGSFQAFWRPRNDGSLGVFRISREDRGFRNRDLWLAVSSDGDGLLIPYNKRIHHKFHALTRFARKWSQTWVAKGRGLCSVILYAAVSGTQPPLSRQRVKVRVREGGPEGSVVGCEKIAVGNGNYTGDASWGHFVVAFAPGEVPLEGGKTYALEFESAESLHTIGGFVNIKGEESDGHVGFNPYRKCPGDDYPEGVAYYSSTEVVDYDLDLQVIEYENARPRWDEAVVSRDLLVNGSFDRGREGDAAKDAGRPDAWKPYRRIGGTAHLWPSGPNDGRFLRLAALEGAPSVDGGWVQRVARLDRTETYRLRGRVRSTWTASVDHRCQVGFDPTGQTDDPEAETVEWVALPEVHGEFVEYRSRPIRPEKSAISVWLRARSGREDERFPFHADFDDFSLRRVATGVPGLHGDVVPADERTRR